MSEETILLIDDDETLLGLLADQLKMAGYLPVSANEGRSGLRLASETDPDLVILDVMMPHLDGWEVCRRLRETLTTPIIMLTAKDEEVDKLRGFRLGVDDYVTKPFSFAELVARVGAILGRAQRGQVKGKHLTRDDLSIEFEQKRVSRADRIVELTPTEYRLLAILAHNTGRTVPNEVLLKEVWGPAYAGEVTHIKHYIWALRKKLEADPGDPKHIITERGFGYRFE